MKTEGKPLRLSAGRFGLSDELVLLCVPEWFRAALLDVTHRFLWSRVWTSEDGTEHVLTEDDRKRIEFGIFKLSQEECDMEIINNVNVNCSCGGCSGGGQPTTLYCVLPDGTPVITPQPPPPTTPPPPITPVIDELPEGYEDWDEYNSFACTIANWMWWWARSFVATIETLGDVLAVLATLVTLIVPLLPAAVIAAIGGVVLLDILWQLVQILVSEQASDILNEIGDWLEEKRAEIVCRIYSHRYDYGVSQAIDAGLEASAYVQESLTLSSAESTAVQSFIRSLLQFTVWWARVGEKVVPLIGIEEEWPAINCAGSCASDFEWDLVQFENSTMTIEYQTRDTCFVSGLPGQQLNPAIGLRGGLGIVGGMVPVAGADAVKAVRFFVHELSTNKPNGFQATNGMGIGYRETDISNQIPQGGITNKSILIKSSVYTGPETEDYVISATGNQELWIPALIGIDSDAFEFGTSEFGSTQWSLTFRFAQFAMLDENGNALEVQSI